MVATARDPGQLEEWAAKHPGRCIALSLDVTQAVLPHLRERRTGHVVQISSLGGVGSMAIFGAYNASKWALEGFNEALASEHNRRVATRYDKRVQCYLAMVLLAAVRLWLQERGATTQMPQ